MVVNHKPKLLLFDVDGTLTDSAGLTRTALEMAAKELYNIENSTRGIKAYGQTDRNIFDLMIVNNHLNIDADIEFPIFTKVYQQKLRELLFASSKPRLHIGVRELLERLKDEDNIYLALGTGNVEGGARIKLERHNINHYFPVGGFGSDSSIRYELLSIGIKKASLYYKIPFEPSDTWVIGDTPNDVKSGKRIGANTIAVATGFYPPQLLATFKPTALFLDLSDADHFIAVVRNESLPTEFKLFNTNEQTDEEPDPL